MKAQINKECTVAHYLNKNILNEFFPHSASYTCKDDLLTKHFEHTTLFEWEAYIYSNIVSIVPIICDLKKNEWTYDLTGLRTIRDVLRHREFDYTSLFNFVDSFQNYSFIHGNLKIDNLFMNDDNEFFVIDFTHSIIKEKNIINQYTDFYSIYNSIRSISGSTQLNALFNQYVPQTGY